jgi:hypothetical protein
VTAPAADPADTAAPTYEGIDDRPLSPPPVDALLLVSFGGPEAPEHVLPFMENVTRGRGIPQARLEEVSRHYLEVFDGVSPINAQARALKAALEDELARRGPDLPVYWGNRNWDPYLVDAVREMRDDGRRHALAVVTSAYPSYSGCRQYREDWWRARREVGEGAPLISKLRHYWAEDGFLDVDGARRAGRARAPRARRAPAVLRALDPDVDGGQQRPGRRRATSARSPRPAAAVVERLDGARAGTWCGSRAAARRRCRGSSPDVGDHLACCTRGRARGGDGARSASPATTSRCCTTSTCRPRSRVGELTGMVVRAVGHGRHRPAVRGDAARPGGGAAGRRRAAVARRARHPRPLPGRLLRPAASTGDRRP